MTLTESQQKYKEAVVENAKPKKTSSPLDDPKILKETIEAVKNEFDVETAQEILKQSKRPTFNVLSLKELHEYECPAYTWRVDRMIQDKKIIIMGGPSAVGKSWLLINLGLCVAKGIPFLDNFPTEQGAVLFIDRENSIPELQNRVEMTQRGLGIEIEEDLPLYFLSEQSLRLDEPAGRDFLKAYIIEHNIKLVVVDTYRRVITFEENDANSVSFFFTECLKPICEQTGASFIFIHHHKKGRSENDEKEMLRGSSDLVNFVDGVLQLSKKGNKITIKQTKNRSGKELEPFDVNIETDEQEYFKFKYLGQKRDISALGKTIESLMVWFGESKVVDFKTAEARDYCFKLGIKKQRFFEGLEELQKRGIISKTGRGMYKIGPESADLEKVLSPLYKSGGLTDFHHPSKSESPESPNGLSGLTDFHHPSKSESPESPNGLSGLKGLKKKTTRDVQYWADPVTKDIQPCNKQEVLDYIKTNPKSPLPELLRKFGAGVMDLKKEGLI